MLDDSKEGEIYCLVDSVASVEHLSGNLKKAKARRRIGVLVEIGKTGWRTGARSEAQAQDVFRAVREHSDELIFRGFEAFEGLAKSSQEAEDFLAGVAATAERIGAESPAPELIFSIGGSSHLGPVKRVFQPLSNKWTRVLRSGCYVTHDHGIYAKQQTNALAADPALPRFVAALELWACVQSLPDPGVAILTFGKRDCAYDIELPLALDLPGAVVTAINDQHAYLSYPADVNLTVGTKLSFGISHPCTAFDKWRTIPLVDDEYNVIDIYRTCF
jgi:D-serine dehydratase